ncbi:MAG: hypothetical protein M1820_010585 [Bogoriella megaspora]|nr:MAG: hypothetical protein M1820_010585 [Bogoriella megaspora]
MALHPQSSLNNSRHPQIIASSVHLPHKHSATLSYSTHVPSNHGPKRCPYLLVFLSGLEQPQTAWSNVSKCLLQDYKLSATTPPFLAYDRYGCGASSRDPSEVHVRPNTSWPETHDIFDAVQDLRQLLLYVGVMRLGYPSRALAARDLRPVFVASSLGTFIARLYAQFFPGSVAGLLLIDPIPIDIPLIDTISDLESPDFDARSLPEGVTKEMCVGAKESIKKSRFHHEVKNREGLRWGNVWTWIPNAQGPVLKGPREQGRRVEVTVVKHDAGAGVRDFRKMFRIPEAIVKTFFMPRINQYHEALPNIAGKKRGKGPLVAIGAGHNPHIETPDFIVTEMQDLLERILRAKSCRSNL